MGVWCDSRTGRCGAGMGAGRGAREGSGMSYLPLWEDGWLGFDMIRKEDGKYFVEYGIVMSLLGVRYVIWAKSLAWPLLLERVRGRGLSVDSLACGLFVCPEGHIFCLLAYSPLQPPNTLAYASRGIAFLAVGHCESCMARG